MGEMNTSPQLLTAKNVAQILHVSRRQVLRLAQAGKMPTPVRLGRLLRWEHAALDAWVRGGCQPPATSKSSPNDVCAGCGRAITQNQISAHRGDKAVFCEDCAVRADFVRGNGSGVPHEA